MQKSYLYILVLCMLALKNYAQENPTPAPPPINNQSPVAPKDFNSFKERLYVGGNVGAWFGSSTYINISPLVGFKVTKELSFGVTGTYNYFSQTYNGQKFVSTIYGFGVFGRYLVFENFFAQVGAESLLHQVSRIQVFAVHLAITLCPLNALEDCVWRKPICTQVWPALW